MKNNFTALYYFLGMSSSDVKIWSIEQVNLWLEQNGLQAVVEKFSGNITNLYVNLYGLLVL